MKRLVDVAIALCGLYLRFESWLDHKGEHVLVADEVWTEGRVR